MDQYVGKKWGQSTIPDRGTTMTSYNSNLYYVITSATAPTTVTSIVVAKWLNLDASATSWNIYPTNVSPVVGNEIGKLTPSAYGGLSYQILANPMTDVYTIQTAMYGKVNIYSSSTTSSSITITRKYAQPSA